MGTRPSLLVRSVVVGVASRQHPKELSWNVLHVYSTLPPLHYYRRRHQRAGRGANHLPQPRELQEAHGYAFFARVLESHIVAPGQHIKEPFQECSSSLLTPSLQHTTVGDIGVLKDMPITHLNLGRCSNLTGEWVKIL